MGESHTIPRSARGSRGSHAGGGQTPPMDTRRPMGAFIEATVATQRPHIHRPIQATYRHPILDTGRRRNADVLQELEVSRDGAAIRLSSDDGPLPVDVAPFSLWVSTIPAGSDT
jgi:hypothetical protein